MVGCMKWGMVHRRRGRVAAQEAGLDTVGNETCSQLLWVEAGMAALLMNTTDAILDTAVVDSLLL